jgi:hypothetical protein
MGLRFVGQRDNEGRPLEYVGWAPARDLTDAECDEIGDEKVAALVASNLYERDAPVKAGKAQATSAQKGEG